MEPARPIAPPPPLAGNFASHSSDTRRRELGRVFHKKFRRLYRQFYSNALEEHREHEYQQREDLAKQVELSRLIATDPSVRKMLAPPPTKEYLLPHEAQERLEEMEYRKRILTKPPDPFEQRLKDLRQALQDVYQKRKSEAVESEAEDKASEEEEVQEAAPVQPAKEVLLVPPRPLWLQRKHIQPGKNGLLASVVLRVPCDTRAWFFRRVWNTLRNSQYTPLPEHLTVDIAEVLEQKLNPEAWKQLPVWKFLKEYYDPERIAEMYAALERASLNEMHVRVGIHAHSYLPQEFHIQDMRRDLGGDLKFLYSEKQLLEKMDILHRSGDGVVVTVEVCKVGKAGEVPSTKTDTTAPMESVFKTAFHVTSQEMFLLRGSVTPFAAIGKEAVRAASDIPPGDGAVVEPNGPSDADRWLLQHYFPACRDASITPSETDLSVKVPSHREPTLFDLIDHTSSELTGIEANAFNRFTDHEDFMELQSTKRWQKREGIELQELNAACPLFEDDVVVSGADRQWLSENEWLRPWQVRADTQFLAKYWEELTAPILSRVMISVRSQIAILLLSLF